eukprot:TRINITY_DN115957_c0_g1_i1.p1 TRINITY_DN115957_c0_g1~~TRINITY_DN115957_c0_g1_i1.p1  ORF type:complete len:193 (+),score=16.55 TRINITY_DN115957_c0_g1_i1:116-694(+)
MLNLFLLLSLPSLIFCATCSDHKDKTVVGSVLGLRLEAVNLGNAMSKRECHNMALKEYPNADGVEYHALPGPLNWETPCYALFREPDAPVRLCVTDAEGLHVCIANNAAFDFGVACLDQSLEAFYDRYGSRSEIKNTRDTATEESSESDENSEIDRSKEKGKHRSEKSGGSTNTASSWSWLAAGCFLLYYHL